MQIKTIGFIGMGNMGQAILRGFYASGSVSKETVFAYAPDTEKLKKNADEIGFTVCSSNKEVCERSDLIILSCKPYQIKDAISDSIDTLKGKALVSIAAGCNYDFLSSLLPDTRIQVIMPNTPLCVNEGVVLFEEKNSLEEKDLQFVKKLFSASGLVEVIPSKLMGIAGTLTGCGPAFIDLMIEAFGDAGVKYGLKREQAYRLVSAMIKGSASLQLNTGKHPGILKDAVCSPAGTTIKGVSSLEKNGFRSTCIEAIDTIMNS